MSPCSQPASLAMIDRVTVTAVPAVTRRPTSLPGFAWRRAMMPPVAKREGPTTAGIEVVPATPERWEDVRTLMGRDGDRGCWCQYWRLSSSDYNRRGPGAGEHGLRAQLEEFPAPGMLAYVDGEVAGWCGLWPRPQLERLVRSRTIPQVDDVPVWSIVCFLVRVGYRRRGVARALLDGAIDYARRSGAPALEAYPVEPGERRVDVAFGYVGFTPMFEAAGFERIVETAAQSDHRPRILMRLPLSQG
jgi:GNAT superfamily N-acetyltransferase